MESISIGTHDGFFHTDELFGVLVLKLMHEARGDEVEIVRSRDPEVLSRCTYQVDVGRLYYHIAGRYDHHQPQGAGARLNGGVAYASAGLVWRHHGAELTGDAEVAEMIDRDLMTPVDFRDNNGPQGRGLHVVELADMLANLFPCWDEDGRSENEAFMEALAIVEIFLRRTIRRVQSKLSAAPFVRKAIAAVEDQRIVILERGCPWYEVLIPEAPHAKFVIIRGDRPGEWRAETVPISKESKTRRASFPQLWGGLDKLTLVTLTGIADAKFAPKGGYMCVASSREGAIALAKLALVV